MAEEGILFVGDRGTILAGFLGQNPQLFAKSQSKPLRLKETSAQGPRSGNRHNRWLQACKGGDPSPGSFMKAAAITDAVNLATVALRAGKKVQFDSDNMRITNADDANKYLVREYREGWKL